MKFYVKKRSSYSSTFGGVLSLILYSFLFIMTVISLMGLINNTVYSMTQTKIALSNWEHKDIKFKDLIDLGFQMPTYLIKSDKTFSVKDFYDDGWRAIEYGTTRIDWWSEDDFI
jgi:hypothetical protein